MLLLRSAPVVALALILGSTANAGTVFVLSDASGLSAEVEFTLINPTTLEVRAKNTSTGVPSGFDNADQLLTGISWDFGDPGFNGDAMITGGTILTGPTSASLNFDVTNVGSNADVGGEYGFGNMDGTGLLTNFITGSIAGLSIIPFGGANLDGPVNLDGPQAGMVADSILVPLGGLGAIQNEVVATLTLDTALADLGFLFANGVEVEFGSDAFFIFVPEPGSGALLAAALAGLGVLRRRPR